MGRAMLPVGDGNAGGRTLGLLPFRCRVEDSKALRIKWLRVFELLRLYTLPFNCRAKNCVCHSSAVGGMLSKDVAMLSTFDSSEARVGAMVAGVELQQKLLQRLRMLPGEAPQADEDRLEAVSAEANRLKQQIVDAKKEKDFARSRRQSIEKESVCEHTNTAKQIANYHCRLQAMHNTIAVDKEEANSLRQNCRNDDRKKQSQQALARKLKEEADLCKAHKAKLVVEVQTESDKMSALRAEVKTYEQRLKEALERKVLAEAEVMAAKMAQAAQEQLEKEEEDETRNVK